MRYSVQLVNVFRCKERLFAQRFQLCRFLKVLPNGISPDIKEMFAKGREDCVFEDFLNFHAQKHNRHGKNKIIGLKLFLVINVLAE